MAADGREVAGAERGETLLELLVALMVIGVAVVVLVSGIGTSIRMSDIHRKQAVAGAHVRAFAEVIVTRSLTNWDNDCLGTAVYDGAYATGDSNYRPEVTAVTYWSWTDEEFVDTCAADIGVQRVSLRVSSSDDLVAETLDVVIRRPCSPAEPCT